MILTEEKRIEFLEAAKPLIKFINENCHPHVIVNVHQTGAELLEGVTSVHTEEFVRD